ncbi:MAG: hypothetical protein KDD33_13370 [Bdellovibrionales bacterium]|nr:hypothetical protein [Bdellovibrionales bacterium]
MIFLFVSLILSGLQASLHFLPFALPAFWFTVMVYYSFEKPLLFSLIANSFHIFVLTEYTSASLAPLLFSMNIVSLVLVFLRGRFHLGMLEKTTATAISFLSFQLSYWILASWFLDQFYYPNLLAWLGMALVTTLAFPLVFVFLKMIDSRLNTQRVDTLEILRV